jgi:hypothetical protein
MTAATDGPIQSRLADGNRVTFTVRQGGRVVGMTSVLFDPGDPAGAEGGGTQFDPAVWGTGVSTEVKRLLFKALIRHGAHWIQLRTGEHGTTIAYPDPSLIHQHPPPRAGPVTSPLANEANPAGVTAVSVRIPRPAPSSCK